VIYFSSAPKLEAPELQKSLEAPELQKSLEAPGFSV